MTTYSIIFAIALVLVICGRNRTSALQTDPSFNIDEQDILLPSHSSGYDESGRSLQEADPSWWPVYRSKYGKRLKKCKNTPTVPQNNTKCIHKRSGDYTCFWGTQTCASDSSNIEHPKTKCDCLGNGLWNCVDYRPCEEQSQTQQRKPFTVCPARHPLDFSYKLTCQSDFLVCNYGHQTCCGKF